MSYVCDACMEPIREHAVTVSPRPVPGFGINTTEMHPAYVRHYHQDCVPDEYRIREKNK